MQSSRATSTGLFQIGEGTLFQVYTHASWRRFTPAMPPLLLAKPLVLLCVIDSVNVLRVSGKNLNLLSLIAFAGG